MDLKRRLKIAKMLTNLAPFTCTVILVIHLICDFLGCESRIFNYIGGTSIIVWMYLLWNSYVFSMCLHHRIFIYYLILANLLGMTDYNIGLPITTENYCLMLFLGFGISVILYSYLKFKENKKRNEHIRTRTSKRATRL